MYQKIETVEDALKAAKQAVKDDLQGLYPMALRILADHVNGTTSTPYARREYKVCYVENGMFHLCDISDNLAEAEELLKERQETFAPLEVVLLEKETVVREIKSKYTINT